MVCRYSITNVNERIVIYYIIYVFNIVFVEQIILREHLELKPYKNVRFEKMFSWFDRYVAVQSFDCTAVGC